MVLMTILYPTVPNRVASYSNAPLKYTHAEMCGLSLAWRRRLSVSSVWANKFSHITLGKEGSTPASTDKMCLETTNGSLSYISSMYVGWHQLVGGTPIIQFGGAPIMHYTSLKLCTDFVIQDLYINLISAIRQALHN